MAWVLPCCQPDSGCRRADLYRPVLQHLQEILSVKHLLLAAEELLNYFNTFENDDMLICLLEMIVRVLVNAEDI